MVILSSILFVLPVLLLPILLFHVLRAPVLDLVISPQAHADSHADSMFHPLYSQYVTRCLLSIYMRISQAAVVDTLIGSELSGPLRGEPPNYDPIPLRQLLHSAASVWSYVQEQAQAPVEHRAQHVGPFGGEATYLHVFVGLDPLHIFLTIAFLPVTLSKQKYIMSCELLLLPMSIRLHRCASDSQKMHTSLFL